MSARLQPSAREFYWERTVLGATQLLGRVGTEFWKLLTSPLDLGRLSGWISQRQMGKTVPATGPCATEAFQERALFQRSHIAPHEAGRECENPHGSCFSLWAEEDSAIACKGDAFLSFSVKCPRVSFCFQTAFLSSPRLWCFRCKVC